MTVSYFEEIKDLLNQYFGMSVYLIVFLVLLLVLLLRYTENEKIRLLGWGCLLLLFIGFFYPTAMLIRKCIGISVYWRFFWLLPVNYVLAFGLTEMIMQAGKKKHIGNVVLAGLILLCLLVSGKYILNSENYSAPQNRYEISQITVEFADAILEHADEGEEIKAIFPPEYVTMVRVYDARIKLLYGRKNRPKVAQKVIACYESARSSKSHKRICRIAKKRHCNFIVYPCYENTDEYFAGKGYIKVAMVGWYGVYKENSQ